MIMAGGGNFYRKYFFISFLYKTKMISLAQGN